MRERFLFHAPFAMCFRQPHRYKKKHMAGPSEGFQNWKGSNLQISSFYNFQLLSQTFYDKLSYSKLLEAITPSHPRLRRPCMVTSLIPMAYLLPVNFQRFSPCSRYFDICDVSFHHFINFIEYSNEKYQIYLSERITRNVWSHRHAPLVTAVKHLKLFTSQGRPT